MIARKDFQERDEVVSVTKVFEEVVHASPNLSREREREREKKKQNTINIFSEWINQRINEWEWMRGGESLQCNGWGRRLLIRRRDTRGRWKMFSHKWSRRRISKSRCDHYDPLAGGTDGRWMDEWFTRRRWKGGKKSIYRPWCNGRRGDVVAVWHHRMTIAWVSRTKQMMDEFKFNMGPHVCARWRWTVSTPQFPSFFFPS